MKNLFAVVLVAASVNSMAAEPYRKVDICAMYVNLYDQSANQRDLGESPEHALKYLKQFFVPKTESPISEKQVKGIINAVYFDPGFEHARGAPFRQQVWGRCANDWKVPKPFQPLK